MSHLAGAYRKVRMHVSDGAEARVGRYEPLEVVSSLLKVDCSLLEISPA